MGKHPIRAVIFDSDGTLVETERLSYGVLATELNRHGIPMTLEEALANWSGADMNEMLRVLQAQANVTLPKDFMETFRAAQHVELELGTKPIEGAKELLEGLGLPRGVASNAPVYKVELCLRTAGLIEHFDTANLFSAYDVEAWKPRPDVFLHAASSMGFEPAHCAVVEDSCPGVMAARAAGMQAFALDPEGLLDLPGGVQRLERLDHLLSYLPDQR